MAANTPGVAINEAVELAKKYGSDEDLSVYQRPAGCRGPGAGAECRTAAGAGRTVSRYTLGIDTSNYATSLGGFDTAGEVVCAKKRFLPVKQGQLGLRQSDALFHHTAALPEMLAQLNTEFELTQIQAVGASQRPRPVEGSYMPCFLAGVNAAPSVCFGERNPAGLYHASARTCGGCTVCSKRRRAVSSKGTFLFHISGGTTDFFALRSGEKYSNVRHAAWICMQVRLWTEWASNWDLTSRQEPWYLRWRRNVMKLSNRVQCQGDAMQPFWAGKSVQCFAGIGSKSCFMFASTACFVWRIRWSK